MTPPYHRATVRGDVHRLIQTYHTPDARSLTINDVTQYIAYLRTRYPNLTPLAHITPQLFQNDGLETYFRPALQNYTTFVAQQQSEMDAERIAYLKQYSRCQICSFGFTPLLQIHHVIPLSEGGDNRLLVVLCPTCHKLIHRLITIRTKKKRQERLEFDWWIHKDNLAEWWVNARTHIDGLVNLYLKHLEYESFATFFQQFVQGHSHEHPFIIINSVSERQTFADGLFS